jgi:CHAD domain-containing protein
MPEENPILIYWQSELDVFNKNLLSLREQMNEEAVHDLRVAIKKLRSCFRIYSELVKKNLKKGLPASIDSLIFYPGQTA